MSILVEAVSVVIPRHVLDASYPGGCDAYLEGARRASGVRFVVADERLTSVSLATLDEATAFVRPLHAAGLTAPDGAPLPLACVDEHFGPTAPAPWLRWRRHEQGYTSCWLEWTEPGSLARPDDHRAAAGASASANSSPGAPEPGAASAPAVALADPFADDDPGPAAASVTGASPATATLEMPESLDPLEMPVWPDWSDSLESAFDADESEYAEPEGIVSEDVEPESVGLEDVASEDVAPDAAAPDAFESDAFESDVDPEIAPAWVSTTLDPVPAMPEESTVTIALDAPIQTPDSSTPAAPALLDALRAGLDRQGWRHGVDAAQCAVFYQVPGAHAFYAGSAQVDADGITRVLTHLPVRIPTHRHAAVVELLTRVNHTLPSGNFDFDYATGEVRFRATTECVSHVADDVVDRLLQLGLAACDRVHEPLMQVVYGGEGPERAVG